MRLHYQSPTPSIQLLHLAALDIRLNLMTESFSHPSLYESLNKFGLTPVDPVLFLPECTTIYMHKTCHRNWFQNPQLFLWLLRFVVLH